MCQKHFQRFKKYGDPHLTKKNIGGRFVLQREIHSAPNGRECRELQQEFPIGWTDLED